MTVYLFLDTCVWINLASDESYLEVFQALERLFSEKRIVLVVPHLVQEEYRRNRAAVLQKRLSRYRSLLKNAKQLENLLAEDLAGQYSTCLDALNVRIPAREREIADQLHRLDVMLASDELLQLEASETMRSKCIQLALAKEAPFHRNKNSVADCLIALQVAELTKGDQVGPEDVVHFVTNNTTDFADPTNQSRLHPELEALFDRAQTRLRFSVNIADTLNEIQASSVRPEIAQSTRESTSAAAEACLDGGAHQFNFDQGGAYRWSRYGGLTLQFRCNRCNVVYDTGESFD